LNPGWKREKEREFVFGTEMKATLRTLSTPFILRLSLPFMVILQAP
jgi:hypothetical protein